MLEEADNPRSNDYDGRDALSTRALNAFCNFFLETCRDQIDYMANVLRVDVLAERISNYARARETGALPGLSGRSDRSSRFRPEGSRLLIDLFYKGRISRNEIPKLLGLKERTARRVVRFLKDEGFIYSETTKSPVRFRIPAHAAPYFFPDLYNPSRN